MINVYRKKIIAAMESNLPLATVFLPSSINGLVLWLKADSLALADGDAVTTWTDSSGLGNNATQAVVDNKPLYKVNIINGKPVVRFGGVDDFLSVPNIDFTDVTVFGVTTNVTNNRNLNPILGNTTWGSFQPCSDIPTYGALIYSTGEGITKTGNNYITPTILVGSNVNFWANGVNQINNGTLSAFHISYVGYSGNSIDINYFFIGDIAEIIVYSSALSDANRIKVEDYLSARWGITVTH